MIDDDDDDGGDELMFFLARAKFNDLTETILIDKGYYPLEEDVTEVILERIEEY